MLTVLKWNGIMAAAQSKAHVLNRGDTPAAIAITAFGILFDDVSHSSLGFGLEWLRFAKGLWP